MMERKQALATATAVVLTIAASAAALASSLGVFGLSGSGVPVGDQQSVESPAARTTPAPEVETVYVDVPASTRSAEREVAPAMIASQVEGAPEATDAGEDHFEAEAEDHADEEESPEPSDEHENEDHGDDHGEDDD